MEGVKREFKLIPPPSQIGKVDILFRQIATLIKVRLALIFGLQGSGAQQLRSNEIL